MNASTAAILPALEWAHVDLGGRPNLAIARDRQPSALARIFSREPARETAWTSGVPLGDEACWRAPADFTGSLRYLAWGARQMVLSPAAEARRAGWIYTLVETGSPILIHDGRSERIEAPALILAGPGHEFSWRDDPQGGSKLLVWMWRQPVHPEFLRFGRDAFAHYSLEARELAELRQLHILSRSEIHRGDTHSETALTGLQALIETCIVRIGEGGMGDPSKEIMERSMKNWIQLHLATRQPLARLADYLGVSPATVQRLFHKHLGSTVMKTVAEMRQLEAERMLARKGVTVKEVAYRLGYRHPHDFSRAFRKHSGSLPSRLGAGANRG